MIERRSRRQTSAAEALRGARRRCGVRVSSPSSRWSGTGSLTTVGCGSKASVIAQPSDSRTRGSSSASSMSAMMLPTISVAPAPA